MLNNVIEHAWSISFDSIMLRSLKINSLNIYSIPFCQILNFNSPLKFYSINAHIEWQIYSPQWPWGWPNVNFLAIFVHKMWNFQCIWHPKYLWFYQFGYKSSGWGVQWASKGWPMELNWRLVHWASGGLPMQWDGGGGVRPSGFKRLAHGAKQGEGWSLKLQEVGPWGSMHA